MPRAAALCSLAFTAGVYLYNYNLMLTAVIVIPVFLLIVFSKKDLTAAILIVAAVFAGFFHTDFVYRKNIAAAREFSQRGGGFTCRISSEPQRRNGRVSAIASSDGVKMRLVSYSDGLSYGDLVYVEGKSRISESIYDYADGAYLIVTADKLIKVGEDVKLYRISDLANVTRQKLLSAADSLWSGENLMFARSVLLGSNDYSDSAFREKLAGGSISHIVAISGLHVSIAAYGILYIIKKLTQKRWARFLCLPAAVFFVIMTGASPSSIRAVIMFSMLITAKTLYAYYDGYTSLGIASALILAANPFSAYTLSFVLSFTAVLGIIMFSEPIKRALSFLSDSFAEAVSVSLAAQVFAFPVITAEFGSFPLTALLANLFAVPLLPFVMVTGYGAVILKLFGISFLLDKAADIMIGFILKTAEIAAKLPLANIKVHSENGVMFVLFWISAVIALFMYLKSKRKMTSFFLTNAALLFLALSFVLPYPAKEGMYAFGGSALFIQGGARVLFVGKNADDAKDYLYSAGVRSVDVLVFTDDSAEGKYSDLAEDLIPEAVLLTRDTSINCEKIIASEGDRLTVGQMHITVCSEKSGNRGYIVRTFGKDIYIYSGKNEKCDALMVLSDLPKSFDSDYYEGTSLITAEDAGRFYSPAEMEEL